MAPSKRHTPREGRPIAFLVSTTPCGRNIAEHLGSPAYSYHFVTEALAPILEEFGVSRPIDHPESRLAFAVAKAEAEGFRPVHLAINPLQDVYLSPNVPNVVFPFWEFPEIPGRDFGFDTRQNWRRMVRGADLVLTSCAFTAEAFRRAGTSAPVAVVPIPVPPEAFDLPDWKRNHSWTLTCRHEVFGPVTMSVPDEMTETRPDAPRGRTLAAARAWFQRIDPWIAPETVRKIYAFKRGLMSFKGPEPGRRMVIAARDGYRRHVRRWLSKEALNRINAAKIRTLALVGREPNAIPDPPLPSSELTLGGGLVYLTIFNIGDERKNYRDIITAFLAAFGDRSDATLVIKLVTNRIREHDEAKTFREAYQALGVSHRCRIVVITEFLTEQQMNLLFQITTFYVNASHAEGACLPLMRALAGGRPAIAPDHTAMADYIDDTVAFVPRSHPEPIHWPHDPERRLETSRYRLVWSDLRDAFLASAAAAAHSTEYDERARASRARMTEYASRKAAIEALGAALEALAERPVLEFNRNSIGVSSHSFQ